MACRRTILVPCLLLLPALLSGCKNPEQEAWQKGYDSYRESGSQTGRTDGTAAGRDEGTKKGVLEAQEAAKTGAAWQLYFTLAIIALTSGLGFGLFIQYAVLVICRLTRQIPEGVFFACIPAIDKSKAYLRFEHQCQVIWEIHSALAKIQATTKLKEEQRRALKNMLIERVRGAQEIEQVGLKQLVRLYKKEMAKIMGEERNDKEDKDRKHTIRRRLRVVYPCPFCKKDVVYKEEWAGRAVKCPHKDCNQPIRLPMVISDHGGDTG